MKKNILYLILISLISLPVSAQMSEKQAKAHKVKSISEWETDLRERRPEAVLETYARFDEDGRILEIQERDGSGVITLHEKYTYDADGNKITEEQYDERGNLKKRHVYAFQNGLRVSRKTYDERGDLIGEKKYVYEFYK